MSITVRVAPAGSASGPVDFGSEEKMSPQPAEQRRLQYRAETRRAILDAAEDLLVDAGVDAFEFNLDLG